MKIAKNSKIGFYVEFLDQVGEYASVADIPKITIRHYNGTSIIVDLNSANMTLIDNSLYYYEFTIADDTVYCAVFSCTYSGGEEVVGSQIVIGGDPEKTTLFAQFTNNDGEVADVDNAKYRVLENGVVLQNWNDLTLINNSLYYVEYNLDISQRQIFIEFKADLDFDTIYGGYLLDGTTTSNEGGGVSPVIVAVPQTGEISIKSRIANIRLKNEAPKIGVSARKNNTCIASYGNPVKIKMK